MSRRSIGDILIEAGAISPVQLNEALKRQRELSAPEGGQIIPVGEILVRMNLCDQEEVNDALAEQGKLKNQG